MLRVHLQDGRTIGLDLSDAEQAKRLLSVVGADRLKPDVSGMVLASQSAQAALSVPRGFQSISLGEAKTFEAEGRSKGFDRLVLFCDDVRLTVLAHAESAVVRLSIDRVGFRRHHPKT